jgi:hypothetical protein
MTESDKPKTRSEQDLVGAIAARIVECYRLRPSEVAKALDEAVDHSGNLLGWVRDLSRIWSGKEKV